jgi:hypothetical protein
MVSVSVFIIIMITEAICYRNSLEYTNYIGLVSIRRQRTTPSVSRSGPASTRLANSLS